MEPRININIKREILNKFTILSGETGSPRKELIEEALESYLKSKGK